MARKKKQPIQPAVVAEVKEALTKPFDGEGLIKSDNIEKEPVIGVDISSAVIKTSEWKDIDMKTFNEALSAALVPGDPTTMFDEAMEKGEGVEVDYFELYEKAKEDLRVQQSHYEYLLKEARDRRVESIATPIIEHRTQEMLNKLYKFMSKGWINRSFSNKQLANDLVGDVLYISKALNLANSNFSLESILDILDEWEYDRV